MSRYWRVYKLFWTSSLQRELEFRANFIAKIFQNLVWIVFFLTIVLVIYSNTDSVAGWNRGDAFVLAATVFLLGSASTAFFFSLMEIPEQVRRGTLDFVVTKPIDSQFWVSLRRFNFDQIGAIIAGLTMLVFGVVTSHHSVTLVGVVFFAVLFCAAVVLYNSFVTMLMTLGIWLVRVDNLWVLGETVQQIARYPIDMYRPGVKLLLTYYLPLAFIATIPASQLVREPDLRSVAIGVAWAIGLFIVARRYWRFAMVHYSSASS
ncbi:MAG: ABC-2 family transporter protein [Armatimonadetes bacterium]|nr:ABC-2 family transporter protein [Armatimonadota bacterium]